MILVLLAVSGSITLLVKRHGVPDLAVVDIPVFRAWCRIMIAAGQFPWDLLNSVALQWIRPYDHNPTRLQHKATLPAGAAGPAARSSPNYM